MKVLILCSLFAAAYAGVVAPAFLETGASSQHRSEDGLGNYGFGYDERHTTGGTFRKEHGDAFGNKVGSYGLVDADGRRRVVNYVADGLGFRANIQTNEPGVEPKDPAAVLINKAGIAAVAAAPIAAYAAAPIAHAIAAPIAHAVAAPIAIPAVAHSYSSSVNHVAPAVRAFAAAPVIAHRAIAPVAAVGHAGVIGHGLAGPIGHGGVIGHGFAGPIGHAGVIGHGFAGPIGHAGVIGHGYAGPIGHAGVIGHGFGGVVAHRAAIAAPIAHGVVGHAGLVGHAGVVGHGVAVAHRAIAAPIAHGVVGHAGFAAPYAAGLGFHHAKALKHF